MRKPLGKLTLRNEGLNLLSKKTTKDILIKENELLLLIILLVSAKSNECLRKVLRLSKRRMNNAVGSV